MGQQVQNWEVAAGILILPKNKNQTCTKSGKGVDRIFCMY
jgi:hypothetical protein